MRFAVAAVVLGTVLAGACGGDDDGDGDAVDAAQPDAGAADAPGPDAGLAPELLALRARTGPSGLAPLVIEVHGKDAQSDAQFLQVELLDVNGTPIPIGGSSVFVFPADDEGFVGQAEFTETVTIAMGQGLVDSISAARVALVDAPGHKSAPMNVAPERAPSVHLAGGACGSGKDWCTNELACVMGVCEASAAQTAACAAADAAPITATTTVMTELPMEGPDNFEGTCPFQHRWGDRVFRVDLAAPATLRVATDVPPSGATLDTYVYLRTACLDASSELACNDDIDFGAGNYRSEIVESLGAGTIYVIVDGSAMSGGTVPYGPVGVTIEIQ
jgi:hypothetical protein